MYVNKISVGLTTIGGFDVEISDDINAGSGASALASLKSKSQIDAIVTNNGETARFICPYHAVNSATIVVTRTQAEDPVDVNCATPSGDSGGV